MANMLKISEAASLALHTMAFLAKADDRCVSTHEIAGTLKVSENHLAKVRQRLAKAGLVDAVRGPSGGFKLAKPAHTISLLEIYEAIEGPFKPNDCLLGRQPCAGSRCVLGGMTQSINRQVKEYLSETTLDKLTTFDSEDANGS